MKSVIARLLTVAGCALCMAAAHSQTYPTKPVTLVVPYATGGTAEILGRVFAAHLGEALGQSVVLDIKAGAGSMIGSGYVAKMAQPDGYTLLLGANPLAINGSLMKLNFDPQKDLAPVGAVAGFSSVMVTSATSPFKSVADVIKASKSQEVTFGSSGPGSVSHMSGELFKAIAGIDMTHVPYKGSGAVYPDLISGRVSLLFDVSASAIGFINRGSVRPLGITSKERLKALPDVAPLAEQGLKGYELLTWFGIFVPAGTPPDIIARLDEAVQKVVKDPAFLARLDQWGGSPMQAQSTADFTRFYHADAERWKHLVQEGKMKRLE